MNKKLATPLSLEELKTTTNSMERGKAKDLMAFFLVLGRFSLGPDLPPCSLSYPPKYCTNLGTLFIIPY